MLAALEAGTRCAVPSEGCAALLTGVPKAAFGQLGHGVLVAHVQSSVLLLPGLSRGVDSLSVGPAKCRAISNGHVVSTFDAFIRQRQERALDRRRLHRVFFNVNPAVHMRRVEVGAQPACVARAYAAATAAAGFAGGALALTPSSAASVGAFRHAQLAPSGAAFNQPSQRPRKWRQRLPRHAENSCPCQSLSKVKG